MSLVDIALLPIRVGLGVADAVLQAVTPASPAPPSELVVVDGMPEGVPAAALRPEPGLPAPAGWPFGEEFPRTCGTSRFAGGALFWTDFLYDDHGATGVPVEHAERRAGAPARHVHLPATGPPPATAPTSSASPSGSPKPTRGGGSTGTRCSTRPSPSRCSRSTPTARRATTDRVAGGRGRPLRRHRPGTTRLGCGRAADRPHDTRVDSRRAHRRHVGSRSFLARVPRSLVEPTGTWTVRLAAGLANDEGDGFADVPLIRGARPGQPNVYNVAFRTHEQEKAHLNFWSDQAQADALDRRRRVPVLAGRPVGRSLPIASPPTSPSSGAPRPGGTSRRSSWDRASPTPSC